MKRESIPMMFCEWMEGEMDSLHVAKWRAMAIIAPKQRPRDYHRRARRCGNMKFGTGAWSVVVLILTVLSGCISEVPEEERLGLALAEFADCGPGFYVNDTAKCVDQSVAVAVEDQVPTGWTCIHQGGPVEVYREPITGQVGIRFDSMEQTETEHGVALLRYETPSDEEDMILAWEGTTQVGFFHVPQDDLLSLQVDQLKLMSFDYLFHPAAGEPVIGQPWSVDHEDRDEPALRLVHRVDAEETYWFESKSTMEFDGQYMPEARQVPLPLASIALDGENFQFHVNTTVSMDQRGHSAVNTLTPAQGCSADVLNF